MVYNQDLTDLSTKPEDYYSQSRIEMLKYIPKNSARILDVGCGQGLFGKLLKENLNAEVWGIELDNEAAGIAGENIEKVIVGDINNVIETFNSEQFDCIVFNDILEHLADPYSVLMNSKKLLTDNGVVVCSIPNVRYIGNLKRLLINKQWRYEDAGILDKTHLRFFTKNSIIETFKALDYNLITIEGINPVKTFPFAIINIFSFGNLSDSQYLQFAVVAKPEFHDAKRK